MPAPDPRPGRREFCRYLRFDLPDLASKVRAS
jgi:hypothetical protein